MGVIMYEEGSDMNKIIDIYEVYYDRLRVIVLLVFFKELNVYY